MKVEYRIDCSPNELRRLLGQADLVPLYEILMVAFERWLVARVALVDPRPSGALMQDEPSVRRPSAGT